MAAQNASAALVYSSPRLAAFSSATSFCSFEISFSKTSKRSCPGQETPFWAVERPVRPCKSTIEIRFTVENAKVA